MIVNRGGGRVDFAILGTLEVRAGGERIVVGGTRQEVILAGLIVDANRAVSVDHLVEMVWDGDAPDTARRQVQNCVSALRQRLPAGVITTEGGGYRLSVAGSSLDVQRFEHAVLEARGTAGAGNIQDAVARFRSGLGLWRGPALAGLTGRYLEATAARLNERRLAVHQECVALELSLGRHDEVIGELAELVGRHPLREPLVGQLMTALYRSGRQADALLAYRRLTRRLADELGLDPGADIRRLNDAILRNDLAIVPPARPARVQRIPAQLPGDVADFTGREAEIRRLDGLLPGPGARATPVVALTGTAGIGKTALAVHWAHRVAGTFTDGQLYVDLRGYAATPPLRPVEALSAVLRALGVSPQRVPVDLDEAVGLYRTLLARTRMLVVLDNAVSCDQVRPLLPGSPTCYVLVTSRDRLSGLIARDGACRVVLDGLPPEAALTLLARIIGADRADAAALAELARLCAYLPLALRAAAANLVNQPHRTVAGYAAELAQQGNRLAALEVDGDKHAAVRAAFDLSYRALSPPLRRMLRHLGLNPGPDFTASSAAALANTTASHAGQLLDQLAAVHLIIPEPAGRYRLHDLLRIYAAQQAESRGGERRAALERLTAWYLGTAGAAAALLYPHLLRLDASAGAVCFDHAGASAWLDTERPNLVAVIQHAAEHGPRPAAWLLADALRGYFALRRHMVDWLTTAKAALAAACHEGETRAECSARLSLGHAYWSLGRYPEAKEQYTGALACAAEACWPEGSATNLGNLGLIYWEMGELEAAADHLASALALDRQTGRRAGEANNQANLGYVLRELGRLDEAADHCAQALSLYRALGAKAGEANALNNLGHVQHDLGRFADALDLLGQALTLYREVGDRSNEADTCAAAAAVHRDAGHYAQAISLAQTALDLARQIGDRRTETDALNALGRAYQRTGCHRQALGLHELALNLARVTGTRYQEAEALLGLSLAHAQADRPDRARSCAAKAAAIARQAPYRRLAELSSAGSDGDGKRTAP